MADRFCAYAAGPLDPETCANIARAARAARFDLGQPPDGDAPDSPPAAGGPPPAPRSNPSSRQEVP